MNNQITPKEKNIIFFTLSIFYIFSVNTIGLILLIKTLSSNPFILTLHLILVGLIFTIANTINIAVSLFFFLRIIREELIEMDKKRNEVKTGSIAKNRLKESIQQTKEEENMQEN